MPTNHMKLTRPELDDNVTFAGILLGLVLGAIYALLHIKQRGAVRRKDLTRFGAGTSEMEMEASIQEAKRLARARIDQES